jgi:hypothetical protein
MLHRPAVLARSGTFGVATGVLLVAGAAAWVATIVWVRSRDMGAMPGTMGFSLPLFVAMWALMMTAMMLPSVWPFVGV